MRDRFFLYVALVLIMAAFVAAGTDDYREALAQERRTAETMSVAPLWAVTR